MIQTECARVCADIHKSQELYFSSSWDVAGKQLMEEKACVVTSSQFHYVSSDFTFTESNVVFFPWLLWEEGGIDLAQN